MHALFVGHTYINVTFLTDHIPTGDEKHVASEYWGGVRLRIDQQQDPALLFRCFTGRPCHGCSR